MVIKPNIASAVFNFKLGAGLLKIVPVGRE
jgi:hypothetical protein